MTDLCAEGEMHAHLRVSKLGEMLTHVCVLVCKGDHAGSRQQAVLRHCMSMPARCLCGDTSVWCGL